MTKAVTILEAVPHHPEADSFDFEKSWMGLRHACSAHKFLIVGTCLVTLGLTLLYTRVWPPTFTAEVVLAGESEKDRSRENFYQNWAVFRSDQLTDEVHSITAAPVLSAVIKKLGLTDDQVYHSFFGYIGYRWTKSWIGMTYRDIKDWIFPPVRGPYDPSPQDVQESRVLQDFKSGVQLDRIMDTNLGKLIVRGPSPRVAEIANTLIEVYFDQRRQRHVQEAEAAYDSLKEELQKAQQEVAAVEQAQLRYYSDNNLLLTFEKDKIVIGQAQTLKAAIVDLETGIAGNEQTLRQVEIDLAKEAPDVVSSRLVQVNPLREGLREKLMALEIARKQTLMHYRPGSPEVVDLDRQIVILKEQFDQEPIETVRQRTVVLSSYYEELRGRAATLRAQLAGQRANLAGKSKAFDEVQAALRTIPEKMRVVHDLGREHNMMEKKLSVIQEKMMIATVSRATAQTAYSTIRVVEAPAAPGEPVWPRTKLLLLIAGTLGLVAGVLMAVVLDLFFGRVHRFRLASAGRDLPIYAMVRRDPALARALLMLDETETRSLPWRR